MNELDVVREDSLPRFLSRWYGPATAPGDASAADDIPEPLRQWYDLRARWSLPWRRQKEMVQPSELELDDGMVVFLIENQAVMVWGYPPDGGPDPQVYERINDVGHAWRPTGEPLSRFLVFAEVMDALLAPRFGALTAEMGPDGVDLVTAGTQVLSDPLWRLVGDLSGRSVRAGADTLVMVLPGEETVEVFLAARTAEALARFDDLDWDWHSADDQE